MVIERIRDKYGDKVAEEIQRHFLNDIINQKIGRRQLAKKCKSLEGSNWKARQIIKWVQGHYDKAEEQYHKTVNDEGEVEYEYKGEKPITSKEAAAEYFNIDLEKFFIYKFDYKAYDVTMKLKGKDGTETPTKRTNYAVSCETKPRINQIEYEKIIKRLEDRIPNDSVTIKSRKGEGIGFAHTADWHTGAKTDKEKDVIKTEDFNLDILTARVDELVKKCNDYEFETMHVSILGDLIESLTGLNHINSWQSMQENIVEGNSIIFAYKIVRDMLERINNLGTVYIVAGNHDRASKRNDQDVKGTVAKAVAYFLKENGFDVVFHPLVIQAEVDGICYVMTHNHFKFSKKDLHKIFFEYGKQGMYNVLIGGHWHSRSSRKPIKDYDGTPIDSVDHRAICVAPLFTGNFYSESIGHTSSAGFSVTYAAESKKNIYHHDIPLD